MDTLLKTLGVLFLLAIGGCGFLAILGGRAAHEVQQEIQSQPASNITLAKFNQLQNGMSYEQVVQVLGAPGEVMSENAFGEGAYRTHTVMYTWQVGVMANMNCMFQNGKLMSKAQFGLK